MSKYTYSAEDFAEAEFAINLSASNPYETYWVRSGIGECPWKNTFNTSRSDSQMAAEQCTPVYAEPYSPEALQRAWEHGEKLKPGEVATEGMVTILKGTSSDRYITCITESGDLLLPNERVVYRPPAPEPDPVGDLTAVLHGWHDRFQPEALAEFLHKHGVKVVADDE